MSTKFHGNMCYKVLNQEMKAAAKFTVSDLGQNAPCTKS
jgi:hypothetical protein